MVFRRARTLSTHDALCMDLWRESARFFTKPTRSGASGPRNPRTPGPLDSPSKSSEPGCGGVRTRPTISDLRPSIRARHETSTSYDHIPYKLSRTGEQKTRVPSLATDRFSARDVWGDRRYHPPRPSRARPGPRPGRPAQRGTRHRPMPPHGIDKERPTRIDGRRNAGHSPQPPHEAGVLD